MAPGAGLLQTVHVPGAPGLALLSAGLGPEVVLFLHGVGGNKSNWQRQLSSFAPHFRAVAWDMRGYAQSDDYEGPLRFEDLSADILRVLGYLDVPKVHLVGLSMGGRIAFDFVHRHPGSVSTLTVCSASHRASEMSAQRRAAFLASRLRPLKEEGRTPADIAPDVARSLMGPNASPEVYRHLVASMSLLRTQGYAKALEAVSTHESEISLESIRVPTHVVAAGEDQLILPDVMRAIARRIPGAVYDEIAGAGHLSNLECPDVFDQVVLGFLLEHAGAAADRECTPP